MVCNNSVIEKLIKKDYTKQDIEKIYNLLKSNNCFNFQKLKTGLYPAANITKLNDYTGYQNVWVRDNFYVAYSHLIAGNYSIAVEIAQSLTKFFLKYKWRLVKIVNSELDYAIPYNRPHIRFNGNDLTEIDSKWSHAQNDALGYYVFLMCSLAYHECIRINENELGILSLIVKYFDKINFWKDKDNGHWEETAKIESSSIGVVTSALIILRIALKKYYPNQISLYKTIDELIIKGNKALCKLLPKESKSRKYDAAQLFLIFPMNIVSEEMEDKILHNVIKNLQGEYGIKRYLGDSFWCGNYKEKLDPKKRTAEYTENLKNRDKLLNKGEEAQWCIFDPIISIIYGEKYTKTKKSIYLKKQIEYFNRSLCQISGEESTFGSFKCPELYYLENNKYVNNDVVPLLWTQSNLMMAFKFMEDTMKIIPS